MDRHQKEALYEAIDKDDSLTSCEKREEYFAEIDRIEAEEKWRKEQRQ